MIKKTAFFVIVISVIMCFSFLMKGIISKTQDAIEAADRIKTLPVFSLPTIEGDIFNSADIVDGPLVIIYFHPECLHCQYEIQSLYKSDIPGKVTKVLIVSTASPSVIKDYLDQLDLDGSVFPYLSDTTYTFKDIFSLKLVPSTLIYDSELQLVKIIKGETDINTLQKYLLSGK